MASATTSKPAAKSKAKAPRSKAKATTKAKPTTLTAGQVATVEAWDEHRKARAADSSVEVDVDLARKIKLINSKAKFDADETAAIEAKTKQEDASAALREPATGTSASASKSKASGKGRSKKTGKPGFRVAAEQVLREADGPMHVKDITEQVLARKMTDTKGGATPVAAMYVQLHQASRKGTVVKVGPSIFDVAELNPKGAKKRPTGK